MMLTMLVVGIAVIAGLLIAISWILRLGAEFALSLFLQRNARRTQAHRGPSGRWPGRRSGKPGNGGFRS